MALAHLRRLLTLIAAIFTGRPLFWKSPAGHTYALSPKRGLVYPPIAGGAPEDGDGEDDESDSDEDDAAGSEDDDSDDGDDDAESGKGAAQPSDEASLEEWKEYARLWEKRAQKPNATKAERRASNEAKRMRSRAVKAERDLKEREDADKSEQEKAVDEAKRSGREEALTEAEKERRGDRLEVAVTRIASKKLTLGDGDDAEEARFADPEDAQTYIERALRSGDIDEADIFDDKGKVKTDALKEELIDLLERKPHWKEGGSGKRPEPKKGDSDLRKGGPADGSLDGMSAEDHAKRKYGTGK